MVARHVMREANHPRHVDALVDAALPTMAVAMARSTAAMLAEWGVKVRGVGRSRPRRKSLYGPTKASAWHRKASTATEWLEGNPEAVEALEDALRAAGVVGMSVMFEMPRVMKWRIARALTYTFAQEYWRGIAETTAGDAERVLRQGLRDGWSTARIADGMEESLGGDAYAEVRAVNIARTESGWALNDARKREMSALERDVPELAMRQVWMSVLGSTTRKTHADLDDVPADSDGEWTLAGIKVRCPGDPRLPAGERCNCQCSTRMEMGMGDEEARRLIQDYYERSEAA